MPIITQAYEYPIITKQNHICHNALGAIELPLLSLTLIIYSIVTHSYNDFYYHPPGGE